MGFKLFYSFLVGVGIFIFGSVLLVSFGVNGGDEAAFWEVSLYTIILWVAQMAMCFVWMSKNFVKGYGLSAKKWDAPVGIGVGLVFQIPLLYLLYLPFAPFFDLDKVSENANELTDRASSVGGKVLLGIIVVLLGPIVEEVFFRGFLQNVFKTFWGKLAYAKHWIVFLVAAIFSLAHITSFSSAGLLPLWGLFILGVALGYSVQITKRLGLAIFIHIGFNLLAFIFAIN